MSVPNTADTGHGVEQTVTAGPEVRRSRGLRFGMVDTDWITDSTVSVNARLLYVILVTFADTTDRDTSRGKPYRRTLAAALGKSVDTVDRATAELEAVGWVTVERRTSPTNPKVNDLSLYILHDADKWDGAWIDPRAGQGGGRTGAATPSRTGAATVAAPVRPLSREKSSRDKQSTPNPAPRSSARSVAPVPKGPRLGNARDGDTGGCAAPNTDDAITEDTDQAPPWAAPAAPQAAGDPQPAARTGSDPAAVRRARSALATLLPAALIALMPARWPRGLAETLAAELTHRTADQIAARVTRRWDVRGYVGQAYGGLIDRPVGVAYALIGPGRCPEMSCEDGAEIDTGLPCRCCLARYGEKVHARIGPRIGVPAGADGPEWLMGARDDEDPEAIRRALLTWIGESDQT